MTQSESEGASFGPGPCASHGAADGVSTKGFDPSRLSRAIAFAANAHEAQVDKAGQPYILHPLRVMFRLDDEQKRIAAVLHDVVEDSYLGLSDIEMQFGEAIADAVDALTRREDESYSDFIERCGANEIARAVKWADLSDNMDLRRLPVVTDADRARHAKYEKARDRLNAIAAEARRAETATEIGGSVHEGAGRRHRPKGATMTNEATGEVEAVAPIPNPPVHHGARRSPEDEALAFLRANRDTHTRWAEYFEHNPEVEKEYLATGVWEGASDQRRLEREYNAAIATFERLQQRASLPHEGDAAKLKVLEIVEMIRERSRQHPSDGLMERQSLDESHVRYGQALLSAMADQIERASQSGDRQ